MRRSGVRIPSAPPKPQVRSYAVEELVGEIRDGAHLDDTPA
jgi:hypothetical protein